MIEGKPRAAKTSNSPILSVQDLKVSYPVKHGFFGRTSAYEHAVDGVSLSIGSGEALGLVGESGCGKPTLGRSIARIVDPTSGSITYGSAGGPVDLTAATGQELRRYQREIRVIFQDPFSSLKDRQSVA